MSRLPDLVRDSEIPTRIISDGYCIHIYNESDPNSNRRAVRRLEHWKRERYIGEGSYGSVSLERCVSGQRDIQARAVKKISIASRQHAAPIDYNRELEAIAKFSQPKYERCFVKAFGWFRGEGALYIALEYLEFGDLQNYLNESPPLSERDAGDVTFQLLEGLTYMHENGFAHRDLKPANILLKAKPPDNWWVKIGDFGISKRVEDELGISNTLKGTMGFIAPELHGFTKRTTDYAPDLWSLGEIAFGMLTKQPTFKNLGLLYDYVQHPTTFPSPVLRARNVSDQALDFIISAMEPLPDKRTTSQTALAHPWMRTYVLIQDSMPDLTIENRRTSLTMDSVSGQFGAWTIFPSSPNDQMKTIKATSQPKQDTSSGPLSFRQSSQSGVSHGQIIRTKSQSPQDTSYQRLSSQQSSQAPVQQHGEQYSTPHLLRDIIAQSEQNKKNKASRWRSLFGKQEGEYLLLMLKGHKDIVNGIAFSPDGSTIASSSRDQTVRLWDTGTGQQLWQLKRHKDSVNGIAFSPDGSTIAFSSRDQTVRLWNIGTRQQLWQLKGHKDSVNGIAFSPDGSTIVSCSRDWTVRQWDTGTGQQLLQLEGHKSQIYSIAFSPDGSTIASCSRDQTVQLWNIGTGQQLLQLEGHKGWVYGIAFSPDGSTIASSSSDKTVRLWDTGTGQQLRQLKGHKDWVYGIAFSPDGSTIVSCSRDQTVQLWDTGTGQQLLQLEGHEGSVYGIAFSPDGSTIASCSRDKTVRLWRC